MMSIRGYEPTDLDSCRSLWAEMTQRHRDIYEDPSIGGENPGLEFDAHLSKVGRDRVWVANAGDGIIGMVSLIQNDVEAEVEPLIVSSQYRGKGIGLKLLEYAVEQAETLGVLCLSVKPVARNEEAISFFYSGGFKLLGHIQMFMWLGAETPGQWKPGPVLFGKPFDY